MKAILLPTDFSNNSINAIHYAMRMFHKETCAFYILNIQKASSFISDDMLIVPSTVTVYNTLLDAAKKSIENIISDLKKEYKNCKYTFHSLVDYDNFVESINQVSEQHQIDLIVMGTHGASGLKKMLFGSNTVHIINRCKVPVLVIPDKCKFESLDAVGFTSSFKSKYAKEDFKFLKALLKCHKSKLHVLHVDQEDHKNTTFNQNVNFFKDHFYDVFVNFIPEHPNSIYDGIHDFAELHQLKLIIMLSKSHSFLDRLFSEFQVETFAFKIDLPLLVLKPIK